MTKRRCSTKLALQRHLNQCAAGLLARRARDRHHACASGLRAAVQSSLPGLDRRKGKGICVLRATTGLHPVATCQSPLRGYMPNGPAGPEHGQDEGRQPPRVRHGASGDPGLAAGAGARSCLRHSEWNRTSSEASPGTGKRGQFPTAGTVPFQKPGDATCVFPPSYVRRPFAGNRLCEGLGTARSGPPDARRTPHLPPGGPSRVRRRSRCYIASSSKNTSWRRLPRCVT
jgi:hypothetical protein